MREFDRRAIATIKGIAMDAPHAARSGHQGTAMALAPLAHVLFSRVMVFDAAQPDWPNRDRFILSAGHASILHYTMLYLCGFGLALDDLRSFRQWGSATPGHPEVGHTTGVEVTTGPLGQGVANMVGMAIAEAQLRTRYGAELFDHHVFGICSDGDLSEGISHEAASLAGHLGLGKIILCYDDNNVTIDGQADLALSDDTALRFRAYGWHVVQLEDDLDAIEASLRQAISVADQPSLLIMPTTIGAPAPQTQDTAAAHGYAIFEKEIAETKRILGTPATQPFFVDPQILAQYRQLGTRASSTRIAWQQRYADLACSTVKAQLNGVGLPDWDKALPTFEVGQAVATRKASNLSLQAMCEFFPGLTGGGADLTGNTGTVISDYGVFAKDQQEGRQIYFGVREHGMGAIANGMALHGGSIPVVGTFLVFSDYMRAAVRLAALSNAQTIFVFSHDSVGVGEDGPTHQPVEHLASLRAIPNLRVIRPADANETAAAWAVALISKGPSALILTRQDTPVLAGTDSANLSAGAYVLQQNPAAQITLVGSGSEVALCLAAAQQLEECAIAARVVSMPCWEMFAQMPTSYQAEVLPKQTPSLAVEAASSLGWHRWVDEVIGIERFGASAPGEVVMRHYGMSTENVVARAKQLLERRNDAPS